jgi:hypothetical protein
MDAAAVTRPKPVASELLLAHCFVFDQDEQRGPTASARLEALLGRELATRLITALSKSRQLS